MVFNSKNHRKCLKISAIIFVCGLSSLLLNSYVNDLKVPLDLKRSLSVALKDGGCFVLPAQEVGPDVKPVFAASYPGSGARMTWNLIEALTGLVSGDEWYSNGRKKDVVTLKTHWPHEAGRKLPWSDEIERAFVIVRNPMYAIPSYHNFIFEYENDLPTHTQRADIDSWIKWRDLSFDKEIQSWKNHLEFYMDNFSSSNRIIVPYEDLTDKTEGPIVTKELNVFLGAGPGVTPIDNDSVPCVWGTVVGYENANTVPNSRAPLPTDIEFVGSYPIFPGSHRTGPKERRYTLPQYTKMIETIQEVEEKYRGEGGRLVKRLQDYISIIIAESSKASSYPELLAITMS